MRRLGGCCAALAVALAACGDEEDARMPRDVVAEVSANVSTVVNVSWKTDQPSIGYIEYGTTEELGQNTPLEDEATDEHALSLLGLRADTLYYYRVVSWEDGAAAASPIASIQTGDLPVGMPRLTLDGDGHDRYTVVPVLGGSRDTGTARAASVVILDEDGQIVWYHRDERNLDFYRARLALDGKSLLYNAASVSGDPSEDSELVRVALDGSGSSSIPVPLLAHDFVELPDGTLAAMVVEYRDFEGKPLRGDKIVEIDPEGEQTTAFSVWDCFDPAEWPGDDIEHGWTFANALDYDPADDAYYLGMRNFSSIVKIDRASGACEWVFGLSASTIKFAPGSQRFLHQHQFQIHDDRIIVLDNDGSTGKESRVLEYQIDHDAKLATQVWSYTADPTVYTFVLGEPTRFDDGSTFVNWSTAGQLERVTPDGERIWKLNSNAGFAFGFHTMAESLYPSRARRP